MFAVIVVVCVESRPWGLVLSRHRTKDMAHQVMGKLIKAIGTGSAATVFQVLPVPKGHRKIPLLVLGHGDGMRTIIAQTRNANLCVVEIREAHRQPWYAIQDEYQSTLGQYETKREAMDAWRQQSVAPVMHGGQYSHRRRNMVHICDGETISPHITRTLSEVTCKKCLKNLEEDE